MPIVKSCYNCANRGLDYHRPPCDTCYRYSNWKSQYFDASVYFAGWVFVFAAGMAFAVILYLIFGVK